MSNICLDIVDSGVFGESFYLCGWRGMVDEVLSRVNIRGFLDIVYQNMNIRVMRRQV